MSKNMNTVKSVSRKTQWLLIAAIIAALLAIVSVFVSFRATPADAESDGSVTIHVYDPDQNYDKGEMGAWVWLFGSNGTGYEVGAALPDEQFKKEALNNTARPFNVPLTAAEVTKLKSGTQLGFLICVPPGSDSSGFWSKYTKETADIFVDISQCFDANNHADIYYLKKDTVAYTDVEEAKMALEKVSSAMFTSKSANAVTVAFEATNPITKDTMVELYDGDTLLKAVKATPDSSSQFKGTAVFSGIQFSFSANYFLNIQGIPTGASVSKNAFIDDIDFVKTFECVDTQECKYGVTFTENSVIFRVWAPLATGVSINIYDNGSVGEARTSYDMDKRIPDSGVWGGVWEYEAPLSVEGKYYTYTVNNSGQVTETIDPYAVSSGVNGLRGMILNLDKTDPVGWDKDTHIYDKQGFTDSPVIWEVQVADFSSSPDSGMKYKGKYLAFTEKGTTVPGKPSLKTGVDYLKELGITYVHLNPVFDYDGKYDESDLSIADSKGEMYNWGYNPRNYNIPKGSFATDAENGEVRVNEFKRMVMALHEAGIGVIMDVVYNHTDSVGGQALNDTVPGYYHRTKADGTLSDLSGCGNDTASERTMMRKYIVDSMVYWAEEYHIDGFRFDLMGIHDKITVDRVRQGLDNVGGVGKGQKILLYGEPWTGEYGRNDTPASYTKRVGVTATLNLGKYAGNANNTLVKYIYQTKNLTPLGDRVAIFGDTGRDGIRGNNGLDNAGWVNGDLGKAYRVIEMMNGYASTIGNEGLKTKNGTQAVAYASAHDNYTLWDQLMWKKSGKETPLYYENSIADNVKRCKLSAAAVMLSGGMSFMIAGEEMGRTKYGNENSYNSPTKLNQIVWSRQEEFKSLVDFYKTVIKIRTSSGAFKYHNFTSAAACGGASGGSGGIISFRRGGVEATLNADALSGSVTYGSLRATI